ncbi:MAG: hypothetical protein K2N35_05545 [Muribaculaceae bacterium]|nr:hypothetical protein [Muribaculaceae bacterium]
MGLWSCTSDEVLPGGETSLKGHSVPVTLTVSRGEAQTRTILSENNVTGGLNDVWESGDKLAVYNSEGVKAGELVIGEGVGTDTGVFTGTVTAENGQYDFNLWYTDPEATGEKEADGKPIYFNSKKEMVVDLSKMPKYTSVEALSAMDILSKSVKLNIKDNNATLVKDETMVAHLAMARFSLNGIPTDKTGTLTIRNSASTEVTGGNRAIVYKERLGLEDSETKGTIERPEGIVVENVKGGEDIYLAFIPGKYTLSFHMEFDGVNYDYAFANATELEAGVYYNAFTKAEGAEEGTIDGVNIPLQKEILAELHVHAAFTGADPEKIIVYQPFVIEDNKPKAAFELLDYTYYVTNYGLPTAPSGYTFKGWSFDDPNEEQQNLVDTSAITLWSYDYNKEYVYAVWEKESEELDPTNPGFMSNWGGAGELIKPSYTDTKQVSAKYTGNGWCDNAYSLYTSDAWCDPIIYHSNGIVNGALYSTRVASPSYYQWGRWMGIPYNSNMLRLNKWGQSINNSYWALDNAFAPGESIKDNARVKYQNTQYGSVYGGYFAIMNTTTYHTGGWSNDMANKFSIVFGAAASQGDDYLDYIKSSDPLAGVCSWEDRSGNPCPDGWRIPTFAELKNLIPGGGTSGTVTGTKAEVREINGQKIAFRYEVTKNSDNIPCVNIVSVPTSKSSVSANDAIFEGATVLSIGAYGFIGYDGGMNKYKTQAFVWSADSYKNSYGVGGTCLIIEFSGNTAKFKGSYQDRIYGMNVIPIRDDNAKHTDLRPWFPYSEL